MSSFRVSLAFKSKEVSVAATKKFFMDTSKQPAFNFGSTPIPVRSNYSTGPPQMGMEMGALYTGGYNQASNSHISVPQTYIPPGTQIAGAPIAPNSMQPHYGYPASAPVPMQATDNEEEEHSFLQEQPPPYDKHEDYKSVG